MITSQFQTVKRGGKKIEELRDRAGMKREMRNAIEGNGP